MKKGRLFLFVIFLCVGFQPIISQQITPDQIGKIKVDELSDTQIRSYWNKAQAEGYTLDQLEFVARSKGMPEMEITKLKQRIQQLPSSPTTMTPTQNNIPKDNLSFGHTAEEVRDSLPQTKENSKIFGYDFFRNPKISFTPNTNMPTPESYVIGTGDNLLIEVWGATENSFTSTVDNQGNILINGIGKINISGLSFKEAKSKINTYLRKIYSGISAPEGSYNKVYTGVSIQEIRTVKINIIGEVAVPGTYSLNAMSTVLNALYACGGPTETGSFRNIKLIRNGKEIANFDIYKYLLNGSEIGNLTLQDQDVIIVPTYENRILVEGKVKRPGAYETKENETLNDLIQYFGGFLPNAYTKVLVIERIKDAKREVEEIDYSQKDAFLINGGDKLVVHGITQEYVNRVSITGAVYQPGSYEFKQNMTAMDLINRANGVRKEAYLDRALIFRTENRVDISTINFSIKDLMNKKQNIILKDNDSIRVFFKDSLRQVQTIKVEGAVNKPNIIKYMSNMTIKDAIALCGGLKDGADIERINVSRQINDGSFENFSQSISISKDSDQNINTFILEPNDIITIHYIKGYSTQKTVQIKGEVAFPGYYTIQNKNERISDLIERSGGLSPYAYINGATLIRKKNQEDEKVQEEELKEMTDVDKKSLANVKIKKEGYSIGIDLKSILKNKGSYQDLILQEEDILIIPSEKQTVEVKGEVLSPSLVRYDKNMNLLDYINRAGGFSNNAKRRSIYVMYANGDVKATNTSLIFVNYPRIEPGAVIIVPSKPERKPLTTQEAIGITSALTTLGLLIYNIFK